MASSYDAARRPARDGYVSACAGASAGLAAGVAVCPLDVVKTRMQVQRPRLGVLATAAHVYAEGGARAFYSGLTPLLIGYLPSWAIYFYVYQRMLKTWDGAYILSATAAGACSTIATNPLWMVKTRLMAQSRRTAFRYTGFVHAVRCIYAAEGARAFYKGLAPSLLGLPHVAIHFYMYETLKTRLGANAQPRPRAVLAASVVSKMVASTLTYPHEVVRARMQTAMGRSRGVVRTAASLLRDEGWRAFYAGLGANICRAVPSSAVTLVTFELVSSELGRFWSLDEPELVDDIVP